MLAGTVNADQTINITGSTAFRAAVIEAIISAYGSGLTGVAYTGKNVTGGNQQLFKGTYPGTVLTGTTYIRTSWNGSVEGVLALHAPSTYPTSYIPITATVGSVTVVAGSGTTSAGTVTGGTLFSGSLVTDTPSFAYSDVYLESTSVGTSTLNEATVGVVPFQWVVRNGTGSPITNITTQLANAILTNGSISEQAFTGNASDSGNAVYVSGRYFGSGTRATIFAEAVYGINNTAHQFYIDNGDDSTHAIAALTTWPNTGANHVDAYGIPITVNDATAGNGGYFGGGNLRDAINSASLSSSISVDTVATPSSQIAIIGYLGIADAWVTYGKSGHQCTALNFNGVAYSLAAVQNGQYTLWGYEHLITPASGFSGTKAETVAGDITLNLTGAFTSLAPAGSPGIDAGTMVVGRLSDGGLVGF